MKIERIALEDCTILKFPPPRSLEDKNPQSGIEQILLSSVYGQAFAVNRIGEFIGSYSVDDYKSRDGAALLKRIPCVYEDQKHGGIKEQVLLLLDKTISFGILPVVNENQILTGGVTCTDNMWDQDKLSNLTYISYLLEKNIDIGCYFRSRNYLKIAFWGLDKLSLTFSNALRHCNGITVTGIYDNIKLKKYQNENDLNYESEIYFVDSLQALADSGIADLIIITDWTMRYAGNIPYLKNTSVDIVYCNTLLKSLEFQKVTTTSIFLDWKNRLSALGIECSSVRIPTEHDLNISNKKQDNMTQAQRNSWFAKENGWDPDGPEVQEFNASRYALQKRVIKADGKIYFGDFKSTYINYINKARITLNNPSEYEHTIYLLGPCIAISLFNQDCDTLGYHLQEYLNKAQSPCRVVALGTTNDADRYYFFQLLNGLDLRAGDKVFYFDQTFKCSQWDLDTTPVFKALYLERGNEFYYDALAHCGKEANQKLAGFIYDYITQEASVASSAVLPQFPPIPDVRHTDLQKQRSFFSGNPQLEEYKRFLQASAIHRRQRIGAIVMNCNPFTLGHQYLIEYAASETDFLYIFVVEEDRSFFSFKDRLSLVNAGTGHIKNVKVLPSGKFIISSNTFSEYFDKANLKGTTIDTSLDVETFAAEIAPCLGITVRFAGEEPLDPITNQYNQSMKTILPRYGIEMCEIPRKESENQVISASRVRNALKEKAWEELRKLVPDTTYDFLYKHYEQYAASAEWSKQSER